MTSSLHEHSQELEQPFAAYQKALRERLHTFLLTLDPVLRTDVIRALQEEGKLLSPEPFRMHTPPLDAGPY
ncbi:hypothetical protein EPA93_41950 [Ktedonosporobacter rubrisoli]|uniref:Uncharacterized protein n=1 Tax=Ktedonosporobacter rubrisoli TaxID=2509675 RepID=A0A4P6K1Y3_KTERU|nr:hypothetical protein [Ktedonosporobacter rubrisoli]QBD82197.1 hypothetical protein EPA93_41950 [Ktedonosporobacter rubrisoli]